MFVSMVCAHVYGFDTKTGDPLWHHAGDCVGGGGRTAVYYDGRLFVREPGQTTLGAATVSRAQDGAVVRHFAHVGPPPAFAGGMGFFVDTTSHVLDEEDVDSGHRLWRFAGDPALSTAPLLMNGLVWVGSQSGALYALRAVTGVCNGARTPPARSLVRSRTAL